MIYLVLAILSSMLVSVLMRLSETRIHNRASMLACNYLMCTVLAASFAGAVPGPDLRAAGLCALHPFQQAYAQAL